MYTTITDSKQTKIYAAVALAALLMTLLAVSVTASQAQATTTDTTTITTDDNNNPIPQQQTTPTPDATPEACPGETGNTNKTAASVVDSGHYALFDVWWNDDEGELTNNICPPSVTYVPAGEDEDLNPIPARVDRSPAGIDITADPPTVIHIPSSAKISLSDSTGAAYGNRTYGEMYPDVVRADNLEDRPNTEGTPVPDTGDGIVWALPACPPDGSASDDDLCLSFSAALLNPDDWLGSEEEADATIDYLVHHVHQIDIDKQDPRYVLVYEVPATGAAKAGAPLWNSHDAREGTVTVTPGGYNRPLWFFTERGTYEFQVNIRGYPDTSKREPESRDPGVTSDVREYIIHVGAEADLSATMAVTPQTLSPGDSVNIAIAVSNAGPDEAQETKVDVTLPDGLTYSSHSTATGTYANGVWSIGEFANGASATLTITATVDAETHGTALTAKAMIYATEPVEITETVSGVETVMTYHVPVPDPTPGNNTATDMAMVASGGNVNPMFAVARSVPENSSAGTLVGGPIPVREPDAGDALTFSLSGAGADKFTASSVSGGAQIAVATRAYLNYEKKNSYDLVLGVSDGKDDAGNADSSIDHTIAVTITITDVIDLTLSSASASSLHGGYTLTWTASFSPSLPAGVTNVVYHWETRTNDGDDYWGGESEHSSTYETWFAPENGRGIRVRVHASYTDENGNSQRTPKVTSGYWYVP